MGAEADFDDAQSDLRWLADQGALAGAHEILRERRRQASLGWTLVHDDECHGDGWLIEEAVRRLRDMVREVADGTAGYPETEAALRQAGALCAAEIDRLNRMLASD